MNDIRIVRDDLTPYLVDKGMIDKISDLSTRNCPSEVMLWEIQDWAGLPGLTWEQLYQAITDVVAAQKMNQVTVEGTGDLTPVIRPTAPTGIGCGNGNVWVTPPNGNYIIRIYVNGILKQTLVDYYITDIASIGATLGDTVQICYVAYANILDDQDRVVTAKGTIGWWAKIIVS